MNRIFFSFVFCMILLTGCSSCKETKDLSVMSIKKINTSIDILDSISRASTMNATEISKLDSTSQRIIVEPPYISADSLAMLRKLWDSIINDPYLGYSKGYISDESRKKIEIYYREDYGVIIMKTVGLSSQGVSHKNGIYWSGSKVLPANYKASDSTARLYRMVDNMPEFPYREGDRDFDDAMKAFKPQLGLSRGRHTVVRFVVEADGTVSNAHIIKSHTPREDYFATVIATYLLCFTPPTHQGKPCRVVYQLEL